jgi:hypothetical protein
VGRLDASLRQPDGDASDFLDQPSDQSRRDRFLILGCVFGGVGAPSVKAVRRNILSFGGIAPVRETLIGGVGGLTLQKAEAHFATMRALGQAAR